MIERNQCARIPIAERGSIIRKLSRGVTATEVGNLFPHHRFEVVYYRASTMNSNSRARGMALNLANAASIVTFEAWRQHGFAGSARLD